MKSKGGPLTRDPFGFRQVLVVATAHGKVFGLDVSNREILLSLWTWMGRGDWRFNLTCEDLCWLWGAGPGSCHCDAVRASNVRLLTS
jgi:hypothetical protein